MKFFSEDVQTHLAEAIDTSIPDTIDNNRGIEVVVCLETVECGGAKRCLRDFHKCFLK